MASVNERDEGEARSSGRLRSLPGQPAGDGPVGLYPLGLDADRDGWLYVPAGYRSGDPLPLTVMLHGAGGSGQRSLSRLKDLADEAGLILLAPDSRGRTWDVLLGGYGPDVAFIDRALSETFGRYAIDPAHVAIEGFSDGASYALSLGLMHGALFSHILAFSPGFAAPAYEQGRPRIFISHGTGDPVLPIDYCSRMLTPMLTRAGYEVSYHEFDGAHTVPHEILRAAVAWFMA